LLTLLASNVLVERVTVLRDTELLVIVDHDLDDVVTGDLLFLAPELSDVGMRECLLHRQPLVRVEYQQLLEEVECLIGCLGEKAPKVLSPWLRHRVEEVPSEAGLHRFDILAAGVAKQPEGLLDLVEGRFPLENCSAVDELT